MMNMKATLVFLSIQFLQISLQINDRKEDFYQAAVVEFSPDGVQEKNLREYLWFIKQTKQAGADIIVFPENTLHGVNGDVEKKLSVVPDPELKIIPCNNNEHAVSEILEQLSCAAQDNTIYVVVNLLESVPCNASEEDCPVEGRLVHNTNVVFDKKGMVVSRYRKYNLRDEYYVNKTQEPELKYFDTDFGVRFGVFTSFDILFRCPAMDLVEKYNITNFIYPSFWLGELPFLTALQIQSGWSYTMNVNLLAAGASKPSSGSGGSGIYVGRKGPPIFSMSDRGASTALIARVPKNVRTIGEDTQDMYETSTIIVENKESENATEVRLQLQRDPTIADFQSVALREDKNEFKEEICSGKSLCCRFKVSYSKNQDSAADGTRNLSYKYRAVAYQGSKSFSKDSSGDVEACAIILCTGPNLEDCGKRPEPMSEYILVFNRISIEANFSNNQTIQMPNILVGGRSPNRRTKLVVLGAGHYDFRTKEDGDIRTVKMTLKDDVRSLITFGIYSRDFSKSLANAFHYVVVTLIFPVVFVNFF